jgi:hypothetical protein
MVTKYKQTHKQVGVRRALQGGGGGGRGGADSLEWAEACLIVQYSKKQSKNNVNKKLKHDVVSFIEELKTCLLHVHCINGKFAHICVRVESVHHVHHNVQNPSTPSRGGGKIVHAVFKYPEAKDGILIF